MCTLKNSWQRLKKNNLVKEKAVESGKLVLVSFHLWNFDIIIQSRESFLNHHTREDKRDLLIISADLSSQS